MNDNTKPDSTGTEDVQNNKQSNFPSPSRRTFVKGIGATAGSVAFVHPESPVNAIDGAEAAPPLFAVAAIPPVVAAGGIVGSAILKSDIPEMLGFGHDDDATASDGVITEFEGRVDDRMAREWSGLYSLVQDEAEKMGGKDPEFTQEGVGSMAFAGLARQIHDTISTSYQDGQSVAQAEENVREVLRDDMAEIEKNLLTVVDLLGTTQWRFILQAAHFDFFDEYSLQDVKQDGTYGSTLSELTMEKLQDGNFDFSRIENNGVDADGEGVTPKMIAPTIEYTTATGETVEFLTPLSTYYQGNNTNTRGPTYFNPFAGIDGNYGQEGVIKHFGESKPLPDEGDGLVEQNYGIQELDYFNEGNTYRYLKWSAPEKTDMYDGSMGDADDIVGESVTGVVNLLSRMESMIAFARGTYNQTYIDEIYTALDNGTISTMDLESWNMFTSGTDNITALGDASQTWLGISPSGTNATSEFSVLRDFDGDTSSPEYTKSGQLRVRFDKYLYKVTEDQNGIPTIGSDSDLMRTLSDQYPDESTTVEMTVYINVEDDSENVTGYEYNVTQNVSGDNSASLAPDEDENPDAFDALDTGTLKNGLVSINSIGDGLRLSRRVYNDDVVYFDRSITISDAGSVPDGVDIIATGGRVVYTSDGSVSNITIRSGDAVQVTDADLTDSEKDYISYAQWLKSTTDPIKGYTNSSSESQVLNDRMLELLEQIEEQNENPPWWTEVSETVDSAEEGLGNILEALKTAALYGTGAIVLVALANAVAQASGGGNE